MIQRIWFLTLMVLCPCGRAWADDWPQWRGPERTGVSKETDLLDSWPDGGPKLLWTFREAGAGFSSLCVVGDRLYSMGTQGDKDCVFAMDLHTQKKLWFTEIGPSRREDPFGMGPRSTPAVDGNFIYAISGQGDLACVETASGRKVWSQGLRSGGEGGGYGYCESPLVDGEQVVVTPGGDKGALAAFDKKTGVLKWRSADCTDGPSYGSMIAIAVAGVRQYVQMTRRLVGVRASDGKLLWSLREEPPIVMVCTPLYQNDGVYFSTMCASKLVKLTASGDKFKAERIYSSKGMRNYHGGVSVAGDYIYGYSDEGGWKCQNFKTGKTAWIEKDKVNGSLIFADGHLYCCNDKGNVLLIKATPAGYQERGQFRLPEETKSPRKSGKIWTHPAVANGKLYLRDQDLIFCYDIRKPR